MNIPWILEKAVNSLPELINISITASYIILIILLVRFIFRKTPKKLICAMWGIAAIRLICPFSLRSSFSLIPAEETIPTEIFYYEGSSLHTPAVIEVISNPVYPQNLSLELNSSVGFLCDRLTLITVIWLAGMLLMLLYAAVSAILLRKKVATATLLMPGVKQTESIDTPFLLGIFRPTVYLPYSVQVQDREYVIAHEKAHIRRKDHLWKPFGFLILSVYWFNPVIWVAYVLLCRDIEAACDEKVIREMQEEERRMYSMALLHCSAKRPIISACPLAFGEVSVKERIQNVMNYKKPAFWIICIAVVLCLVLALCFLTNPKDPNAGADAEWVSQFEDDAEDAIDQACMKYLTDENRYRVFWSASHKTLKLSKGEKPNTLEAYILVLYEEYVTKQEGGFTVASEDYTLSIPAVLTFSVDEKNQTVGSVLEFRTPKANDFDEKLPKDVQKMLKSDKDYTAELKTENLKKINQIFDICTNILMPCDNASNFEESVYYDNGNYQHIVHFKSSKNDPVYAAASGKVIQAGYQPNFGKMIVIQCGSYVEMQYFHLNQIYVKVGDLVSKGEIIGTVGTTGMTKEPSLGFGIRQNKVSVDPRMYLPQKDVNHSEISLLPENYSSYEILTAKVRDKEIILSDEQITGLIEILKNKCAENLEIPAFNDDSQFEAYLVIGFSDENDVRIFSLGLCIGVNNTKKCYAVSSNSELNYAEIENSEEFYEAIIRLLN